MADKSRPAFLIIGGGYLIYTGGKLISEVMKSHPTSETLFIAFGAFFVIFGVLLVGVNLKKIYDLTKSEKESDTVVEDIDFQEEMTEPPMRKERRAKNHVQMVKLESDEVEELGAEEAEEDEVEAEESEEEATEGEDTDDEDTEEEIIEDEAEEFFEDYDEYMDEEDEEFEAESDEDLFEVKLERI